MSNDVARFGPDSPVLQAIAAVTEAVDGPALVEALGHLGEHVGLDLDVAIYPSLVEWSGFVRQSPDVTFAIYEPLTPAVLALLRAQKGVRHVDIVGWSEEELVPSLTSLMRQDITLSGAFTRNRRFWRLLVRRWAVFTGTAGLVVWSCSAAESHFDAAKDAAESVLTVAGLLLAVFAFFFDSAAAILERNPLGRREHTGHFIQSNRVMLAWTILALALAAVAFLIGSIAARWNAWWIPTALNALAAGVLAGTLSDTLTFLVNRHSMYVAWEMMAEDQKGASEEHKKRSSGG